MNDHIPDSDSGRPDDGASPISTPPVLPSASLVPDGVSQPSTASLRACNSGRPVFAAAAILLPIAAAILHAVAIDDVTAAMVVNGAVLAMTCIREASIG